MKTKTIVLIHGLFVNNTSWKEWKNYFEEKGYIVHTPSNPGHDGDPRQLKMSIPSELKNVGFDDTVDNLVKFIDSLPEKPIIIGHSFGGLMVQKLIDMGKAVAGVSIDGAPPKNVMAPFSTVKIVWPVVNFFKGNSPFLGTKEWYHKAFFNNYSKEESDALYEVVAAPESRKLARDPLFKSSAKLDLNKPHEPLLFIAGSRDHIFPANFSKKIAGAYKNKNSIVDFKEFEGRSHFICGEKGWQEVAEYILNWLKKLD
ncbi:alpha/beta hydrolase [Chryseobacterium fistulae]|uniref:2-succinyl-6-hydroxy-2, 4-cyclohexadiene-1-carboxylate synthase n=1 Tax=Chryseobacterium fistulae TaxID=2675058 RepID=A0A6N4XXF1_9FLAO|nr:alpha/beta hydrolase [Chryseobacterium fistulae]CAA7390537.1 2-succinyl-6-hydroxy-2, 4-cyclohexadiene-1-carboxylate synthase [Chryseobacterium fistulae]